MIEINKTIHAIKHTYLKKKEIAVKFYGFIRFPKSFGGKEIEVIFDEAVTREITPGEPIKMRIAKAGKNSLLMFHAHEFIDKKCRVFIKEEDIIEYFKKKYNE